MSIWDWEFFESEITCDRYFVECIGPLHGPIKTFELVRDKDLGLMLRTTSDGDSTSRFVPRRAGEVYIASEEVELKSPLGTVVTLSGVIPRGRKVTHSRIGESSVTIQESSAESIQWQRLGAAKPEYLIEWIDNLATPFHWPDFSEVTESGKTVFELATCDSGVSITSPIGSHESSRSCAYLKVAGIELIIGESRAKPAHIGAPGFILYKSVPDEETRRKIRDCLSFCLGDFLLYLGEATYDEKWHVVALNAKSGHALVRDAERLRGHQPAPLGGTYEREIEGRLLSEMATSLFLVYDKYELRSSFWCYWHAIAAPMHMAAVHFGSGIEGLQSRFLKQLDSTTNILLVQDEQTWAELRQRMSECIAGADIPEEIKAILTNKTVNLNSAPQKVIMERFLTALNLSVGKLELDVWGNRNRAAHGSTSTENPGQLIRENKVLKILMNRIMLALGGVQLSYYDYYNYGHPAVSLTQAIRDDRPAKSHSHRP